MPYDHVGIMELDSLALVDSIDRDPLVGAVIRGDASREDYVGFLISTYHYVRWSGPLLAKTAEGLRRSGRAAALLELVEAKTVEESPHDAWVLDDLRTFGVNVELVKASAAPSAVNAYVQWGLAMAEHGSPAYLGAAYALEFISMHRARTAAENLCARKVIPNIENAVSFLVGHGDADENHIARLNEILRQLTNPIDRDALVLSTGVLRTLYLLFFHPALGGTRSVPWTVFPAGFNGRAANDNSRP